MSIFKNSLKEIVDHNYVIKHIGLIDAILLIFKEVKHEETDLIISDLIQEYESFDSTDFTKVDNFETTCEIFYEFLHANMRKNLVFVIDNDYDVDQKHNYLLYNMFRSTNFGFILSMHFMREHFKSRKENKDFIKYLNNLLMDSFDSIFIKLKKEI